MAANARRGVKGRPVNFLPRLPEIFAPAGAGGPTASQVFSRNRTTDSFSPGGMVGVAFCQVWPPSAVMMTFSQASFAFW